MGGAGAGLGTCILPGAHQLASLYAKFRGYSLSVAILPHPQQTLQPVPTLFPRGPRFGFGVEILVKTAPR